MLDEKGAVQQFDYHRAPIGCRVIAFFENVLVYIFIVIFSSLFVAIMPGQNSSVFLFSSAIVMILLFSVVQAYLLSTRGQSLGMIHQGIKMVRFSDGKDNGFYRNVFLRQIVFRIILLIGFGLVHIADIISLFVDKNGRTLHDRLAGTIVVGDPAKIAHTVERKKESKRAVMGGLIAYSILILFVVIALIPFLSYVTSNSSLQGLLLTPTRPVEHLLFLFSSKCRPEYLTCLPTLEWVQQFNNERSIVMVHAVLFVCLGLLVYFLARRLLSLFRRKL